jgi:hypothetical protein
MGHATRHLRKHDNPQGRRGSSPGSKRLLCLPWEEFDEVTDSYMKDLAGCAPRSATLNRYLPIHLGKGVIRAQGRVPDIQRPRSGNA